MRGLRLFFGRPTWTFMSFNCASLAEDASHHPFRGCCPLLHSATSSAGCTVVAETVQLGVATLTPSYSAPWDSVPELNQRCIQSGSEGEPDEQLSGCAT